jgi:hypothetical protein
MNDLPTKSPWQSTTIQIAVLVAVIPLLVTLLTAYGVELKYISPTAEFILALLIIYRRVTADPLTPPAQIK